MRRAAGEAGFTLVEALLSLLILGIALVPLINLFGQAAERHSLPDEVTAAGLAAAKMEEVVTNRAVQGWASFTATPTAYAPNNVDAINFPGYEWMVEVVEVAQSNFNLGQAGSNYKRITVSVKKPDGQELKLVTIVTNY